MKATSKVIMGATLVMVVSLAVVLGLILVLLAELYCSLLLRRRRRRHLRNTASPPIPTATRTNASSSSSPSPTRYPQLQSPPPPPPPFGSIYAHGVLQAPRNFLFPSLALKDDTAGPKLQHSELLQIQTQEPVSPPHHQIGLFSAFSPPAPFMPYKAPPNPKPTQQVPEKGSISETVPVCSDHSDSGREHLVYISNPIYENEEGKCSSGADTSFETPDTSPSRLERSGSSGDDGDDEVEAEEAPGSPPLSPMKKLPAEACSVSLSNGRSLGTSGSDSHSNNGPSSSSSASPCTSPSW